MIFLLLTAGVTLTASVVSWWNGRQTEQVRAEISALEAELARIRAADAAARRKLFAPYLQRLDALTELELTMRDRIATDLSACVSNARAVQKKRFGSRESATFRRVFLELDIATSRIDAERGYLRDFRGHLAALLRDIDGDVPAVSALQLPNDFPRLGGIVQFDTPTPPPALHGYRLTVKDWTRVLDGRAAIIAVDHVRRTATISTVSAALWESNLDDGATPLRAKVMGRGAEGVHLDFEGVPLLLPKRGDEFNLESEVEVFPEIWTFADILRAGAQRPLRVRKHPRVDGSQKYWSPLLLSASEERLHELVEACDDIFAPELANTPWRVHVTLSGGLGFTMGRVTLHTFPDATQQAFVLERVTRDDPQPVLAVRIKLELSVLAPGSEDEQDADRSLFEPFVTALHSELEAQKLHLSQRRAALRLRKLSLIYQDQQEHLRVNGSVRFLVGKTERVGRIVVGAVTEDTVPAWLDDALRGPVQRLRAIGPHSEWVVKRGTWIDRRAGVCRLELAAPEEASARDIAPFDINHLTLAGEGSQQQTLAKSLERAIAGRFASSRVHESLLGLPGDIVENGNFGRDEIDRLLRSDAEVVAVWGPPGTGKTTTLVKWLRSLFPAGKENTWPTVLIAAPTHVAVNKLLGDLLMADGRLSEYAVRYASEERIAGSGMEPIWHERILASLDPANRSGVELGPAEQRWARTLRSKQGRAAATRWLMKSRFIHAATCTGMTRRDFGLEGRTFDIAIIDEAGKAFGAELLIPAAVARRVVMVGDHNQLPPTVTTQALDNSIGYRLPMSEVEELLKRNVFQDLFEQLPKSHKGMLTIQHRMHDDIGALVSELFYEGRLESSRRERNWSLSSRRNVFVDFSAVRAYRSQESERSQENATERRALRALLERLSIRNADIVRRVLVICPYEAQRRAVAQQVQADDYTFGVDVTTVDAVQGGEADVVILLMTRHRGRVEFLLDRHRLNVALSRAREAVIIFGHLECLAPQGKGPIRALIDLGTKRNTLDLVRLEERASFKRDLACRIVP
ncbi:DEAD/DEAH box helicase [Caballeronia zhejiangensis]|uniref:DEAD/DEAH box helicase n=1 Tax=Caballeronia zhejiangensis TaxID=871203 RepID=UPI001EF4A338|nr:AAA domain-containing protein [Caballeronia zhejiangensis]MCG7400585.1 AAA domain-containing protein [Caballeronia zhejiangensis]